MYEQQRNITLQGKHTPNAFKGNAEKQWNQNCKKVSAVFVRVAAPRIKSSLWSKSWEYGKDLFACFVDLEKARGRVPLDKLWKVSLEYGVDGQLLRAIKSFYCRPEVCVRVNGKQSKPFHVGVGLLQGCVLLPLLFIIYINWIDKCSKAGELATIGNCKINRLLFAYDLVLLFSTESGL